MPSKVKTFEALAAKAEAAGMAAGTGAEVAPMVVGSPVGLFGSAIDRSKPVYFVADGVCGFAWVRIKGNTAFGKFMRKAGKARPGYGSGLVINCRDFNQSLGRKEAWATAYANVLNDAGVDAYSESRMD